MEMPRNEFQELNLLLQEFGFDVLKARKDKEAQEQLDILEERRIKLYLSTM